MNWRQILRENFTNVAQLASFLELSPEQQEELDVQPPFVLNVPLRLAQKMVRGDLNDPIFLQFVPLKKEKITHPDYLLDPVDDTHFVREGMMLQKYHGRALLITTGFCAMNCRFCFRKNFPYDTQEKEFTNELATLRKDPTIQEVLLSGGDPLSLSDRTLEYLLEELSQIPHVRRIRFHTRFPLGIPERIDEAFLAILQKCPKKLLFFIHANHPKEFDEDVWASLKRLQSIGVSVLQQGVLLKGVNDDLHTLKTLYEDLIDHGIMPCYLHQLDRVQGSHHFEVAIPKGRTLLSELKNLLPGYAVPSYVQEVPGALSKTAL